MNDLHDVTMFNNFNTLSFKLYNQNGYSIYRRYLRKYTTNSSRASLICN